MLCISSKDVIERIFQRLRIFLETRNLLSCKCAWYVEFDLFLNLYILNCAYFDAEGVRKVVLVEITVSFYYFGVTESNEE